MSGDWNSMNNFDMSSGMQESSGLGRGPRVKGDRTRRSWSLREEAILLYSLKDLVVRGWKSDNGFRPGYLSRIEDALKREFPNSDLKVNPHIISKITQWKKSYYCLAGILGRSGVGFNVHGDHKIDCDNDQWDQIVKTDSNARFMRNKSWPMWDDWKMVFGKDRATGGIAEDSYDSFGHFASPTTVNNNTGGLDFNAGIEDFSPTDPLTQQVLPDTPAESTGQSTNPSQQVKKTGKKRKANSEPTGLIEMLAKMQEDTNVRLDKLTSRIGYEFELSKKREEVYEILGAIQGLTLLQQFDAAGIILAKVEHIDLFKCLPEASRLPYVMHMLELNGRV